MLTQSSSLRKIKSSNKKLNKPDYYIDRGFEFILTGGKSKNLVLNWMKDEMNRVEYEGDVLIVRFSQ